jgi:asparagine synthase (glutamine-hydrolysing)
MCGIAGAVSNCEVSELRAQVERAVHLQTHRGPDATGLWCGSGAVLGHNRLSIIDLSGGAQPMVDTTGRYVIVFNGEIYNYRELRHDLENAGHRFSNMSDTEVLLHLYIQSGDACLSRLNGMFAFAVWDNAERTLFLARDRLGVKPVYYANQSNVFRFSSEFGALAGMVDQSDIDPDALLDYLSYLYVPAPRTIYAGIAKLPPAHFLVWRDGKVETKRYWNPWHIQPDFRPAEEEWIERIRELFVDATRARLVSDVPLGAFLSGGVDSSAVVSTMATITDSPVKTFTIGFDRGGTSEIPEAREIASRYQTEHTERIVTPPNVPTLLDLVSRHFGEPFGDSSALPTLMVSEIARQHVTVALSGDGGDELFAGYRSYRYYERMDRIEHRLGFAAPLAGAVARRIPRRLAGINGSVFRARNFLAKLGRPAAQQWSISRSVLSVGSAASALAPALKARFDGRAWHSHMTEKFDSLAGLSRLDQIMRVDMQTYLPDDLLVKVDRMSMARSLEVRSPFLDYRLVELALQIPMKFKIRNNEGKWILRRMLANQVPHDILWKPKQGFTMPVGTWFRTELKGFSQEMLDRLAARGNVVDKKGLGKVMQEHISGKLNHDSFLWALLVLETWLANFERRRSVQ